MGAGQGRHVKTQENWPGLPDLTYYGSKILKHLLFWFVVLSVIGLIVSRLTQMHSNPWCPPGVDTYDSTTGEFCTARVDPWVGYNIVMLGGSIVLAFFYFIAILCKVIPGPMAVLEAGFAGYHAARGEVGRAALSGASAYGLAQRSQQRANGRAQRSGPPLGYMAESSLCYDRRAVESAYRGEEVDGPFDTYCQSRFDAWYAYAHGEPSSSPPRSQVPSASPETLALGAGVVLGAGAAHKAQLRESKRAADWAQYQAELAAWQANGSLYISKPQPPKR